MKKFEASIILGVLCIILSTIITMQIKLTGTSESTTSQAKVTDKLKDEIILLNDENNKLTEKLKNDINELEKVRDMAANNDSSTMATSELIKKYTLLIGKMEVNGQGANIRYVPIKDQNISDTAKDLRDIVNELKNAGIEAISINGQRLVSTSAIEMVKNKIEINNKEIASPYTIKVVGNTETIYSGLIRPGGTIENIKNTGVKIDINMEENIKIEKYTELDNI